MYLLYINNEYSAENTYKKYLKYKIEGYKQQ